MTGQTPIRLRQLANDCEERARGDDNALAVSALGWIARQARQAAMAPHLALAERAEALEFLSEFAHVARRYCGGFDESVRPMLDCVDSDWHNSADYRPLPPDNVSVLASALPAGKIASLFGLNDRTARRAIEKGKRLGLPGFYCEGRYWFAERDAFAARMSELCPRLSRGLGQSNDVEDHAPPSKEARS